MTATHPFRLIFALLLTLGSAYAQPWNFRASFNQPTKMAPIHNFCGRIIQPEVFAAEVSAPAPGALLSRDPIHYVQGGAVEVSLVMPTCTGIGGVSLVGPYFVNGPKVLGTETSISDPIEGGINVPYYYEKLPGAATDNGRHRVGVRVHFPDFDDGRSFEIHLHLKSSAGRLKAEHSITVSLIKEANAKGLMSYSEAQIRNGMIADLYNRYGDDGRDDSGELTLYKPSYEDLELRFEEGSIYFRSQVKVAVPFYCDPTAHASGRFHLEPIDGQIKVVWDQGPSVGLEVPLLCQIPQLALEPVLIWVRRYFEDEAAKELKVQIQAQIDALLSDFGSLGINPVNFVEDIRITSGQIRVVVDLSAPFRSVSVEVPYGRFHLDQAHIYGIALNPGEQVMVLGGDLAQACYGGGSQPVDCATPVGPAGLFNWSRNVPVPDPWVLTQFNTYAYYEQRHKARRQLTGLRRDPQELPFADFNPGALIGRLHNGQSASRFKLMADPCAVTAREGAQDRLGLGANDHRYLKISELGEGSWTATLAWLPITLDNSCGSSARPRITLPTGPVVTEAKAVPARRGRRAQVVAFSAKAASADQAYGLGPNHPNPFNPTTHISYNLPRDAAVELAVFNSLGQRVHTLVEGYRSAGVHQAIWDGTNASGQRVAAGVYFYRLNAGELTQTRRMTLLP